MQRLLPWPASDGRAARAPEPPGTANGKPPFQQDSSPSEVIAAVMGDAAALAAAHAPPPRTKRALTTNVCMLSSCASVTFCFQAGGGGGALSSVGEERRRVSAQHFQCILFYWTFYFIFKLFLPFLYQVHYNLCNALKQYRNQCIFLQNLCQTFYTCM